jgi:single-strand DNA-binding protein
MSAKIQIEGHVGQAPEFKTTQSGKDYVRFSVAVNNGYKDNKGDWVNKEPTWFTVWAWKNFDAINRNIAKGVRVLVSGRLGLDVYTNKSGEAKGNLQITADNVAVVCRDKRENENGYPNQEPSEEFMDLSDGESDIPF